MGLNYKIRKFVKALFSDNVLTIVFLKHLIKQKIKNYKHFQGK